VRENEDVHTLTLHLTRPLSRQPGKNPSLVGHVWLSLHDGHVERNFGFHPRAAVAPTSPLDWLNILETEGHVVQNDPEVRPNRAYTRTIPLLPSQHDAILAWAEDRRLNGFGRYRLLSHNCIDFVWEALRQGGVHPREKPSFEGALWPMGNIPWFEDVAAFQCARLGVPDLDRPDSPAPSPVARARP